jgi:uncharacterized repeat protein (TIGR03837 family)
MSPLSRTHLTSPTPTLQLWDVFCRVIDNFGDIGVCWRLADNLAARSHKVRLWVDDASALAWMAPNALTGGCPNIQIMPWDQSMRPEVLATLPSADVWVETFGCEIDTKFIATYAYCMGTDGFNSTKPPVWINLEHLSAEGFAQRNHTLPSPVMHGPAKGWTKHFFYPGFTEGTGGLLREANFSERQAHFDRGQWLSRQGIHWRGERLISLFCYKPSALADFLLQLHTVPTMLLVTSGRAASAVQALQGPAHAAALVQRSTSPGRLSIAYLPLLSQLDYDHLLWACDFNCVRGEDSLVRALWAQKPFVWQIYPQDDGAHHAKLDAFLDLIQADPSLRQFHLAWNTGPVASPKATDALPLPPLDLATWQAKLGATHQRLLRQDDLCTQLIRFVQKNR